MSAVFQVVNGIVHWRTPYMYLSDIPDGTYPDSTLREFIETDNPAVHEGWGYLDGEFIRPTPPEGWLYDDDSGTFYKEGDKTPAQSTPEARIGELETQLTDANDIIAKQRTLILALAKTAYGGESNAN